MKRKKSEHIPKLDLHGVKHQSAELMVENFVIFSDRFPIHIITGHSKEMKDIVIKVLELHGYKYEIGDFFNKGYINVKS